MKVFVVYCHPSEDSFTKKMLDSFVKGVEDAIVFIYPVFWTEAPAKLVGWFDRVWSYGFAYGERKMKTLQKGMILCSAGNPAERLEQFGYLESMKRVMLNDRLSDRVRHSEFVVIPCTSREKPLRELNWNKNLELVYTKGKTLFEEETFSVENRFFTAIENSESGEVSSSTIFCYHQKDHVIWAEYSGGSVVKGFLVGTIDEENNLHFQYQHINEAGEMKSGSCDSKPRMVNGKLRFYEKWKWTGGESGESIIEEI